MADIGNNKITSWQRRGDATPFWVGVIIAMAFVAISALAYFDVREQKTADAEIQTKISHYIKPIQPSPLSPFNTFNR
jgi:hypothetical protein